jgi:tetratricopeptide repeat protein 30
MSQEIKYKEAIGFYEPIVKREYDSILDVSATVLANLCVAYIMTSANDKVCI